MKTDTILRAVRSVLVRPEIDFNRLIGREFIPRQPDILCIETTSVCNLECCFCPYVKKQGARVAMTQEAFEDCVAQALAMGFRRFELTPCTGDVFMDRQLFEKLAFLERNPQVQGYQFYTNFTIPRAKDIERLVGLRKLEKLYISLYGHDQKSFVDITNATEKLYRRLVFNLESLLARLPRRQFALELAFRSTLEMPRRPTSELMQVTQRFEAAGIKVRKHRSFYNNWGGSITQADVKGLPIEINGADATYKSGACALLFTMVQVRANGIVNGCACRDVEATLRIGDLKERPLREIISLDNPAYATLIDEQQNGNFRPVCRTCDLYVSIYHQRSKYRRGQVETETLKDFTARLGKRRRDATDA
jgi:MoaA/NifB/PqqE/SkfB family radical SAM enzyme